MKTVLATLPNDVALKVADDIRDYGRGYVRFDAEGKAHHLPSYCVPDAVPSECTSDWGGVYGVGSLFHPP